jgi:hypothetical protein
MQKKLTLTVDEEVYEGLRRKIGPRKISKFIEEVVRPYVMKTDLDASYAAMAKDKTREKEAAAWSEISFREDLTDAAK